jgi:hypothetical protein
MNESQRELFEGQLLAISKEMDYPRTPDVAGFVMDRLRGDSSFKGQGARGKGRTRFFARPLAWSLAVLLILCSSLMLIPSARAAILEFIQIGVVRIFRTEPTLPAPSNQQFPATIVPVTATPYSTAEPLIPILERLAGEMTLEEAQQTVDYPLLLPSYPSDLGPPDRIFVQDADGDMTILVWTDPQQPDEARMSLHIIPPGSWAVKKIDPMLIEETTVSGQRAIWAIGPYPLRFSNGDLDFIRLIDGHVLIWAEGEITYRLETDLSLEEALKIAESLKAIP